MRVYLAGFERYTLHGRIVRFIMRRLAQEVTYYADRSIVWIIRL